MKKDPKIYFAIDNCFASKRWTLPESWASLIADLGIYYVECSADTECDPLYMGEEYAKDWITHTQDACAKAGIHVANFYSGHGTYSTLGLSHWDARVRKRFRDQWLKKQADTARAFGAGLGFYTHAFDDSVLQDSQAYQEVLTELYDNLADVAAYACQIGLRYIGVEQMYSPHQVPWTIPGAQTLLREIYNRGQNPFYLTIDVGHMSGQQFFQLPTEDSLLEAMAKIKSGEIKKRPWIGRKAAVEFFDKAVAGTMGEAAAVDLILADAAENPHMFASEEDGSAYKWLEQLGCYSPIVHLQQNDGKSSPHWPFDENHNKIGIIEGARVLRSLAKSFEQDAGMGLPMCEEVVLTLEPFISTAGNNYAAVDEISQSVSYWRQFIPKDGLRLSELLQKLDKKGTY